MFRQWHRLLRTWSLAQCIRLNRGAAIAGFILRPWSRGAYLSQVVISATAPGQSTNISQSLAPAMAGKAYTQDFDATGGGGSYTFVPTLDMGMYVNGLKFTPAAATVKR